MRGRAKAENTHKDKSRGAPKVPGMRGEEGTVEGAGNRRGGGGRRRGGSGAGSSGAEEQGEAIRHVKGGAGSPLHTCGKTAAAA